MAEVTFEKAYSVALRIAEVRANAAVKSGAVPAADKDDIQQEVLLACWRSLPQFDPSRGCLRTFLEMVAAAQITSIIRSAGRSLTCESLDAEAVSPHAESVIGTLELSIDVETVVASLRPEDRELAVTLMKHSLAEASRILGVPKSTVHDRLARIRRRFSAAGLKPVATRERRGAAIDVQEEERYAA